MKAFEGAWLDASRIEILPTFRARPQTGPGRRSWFSPRLRRPSKYDGRTLRAIRVERGVGRPPERSALVGRVQATGLAALV